MQPRLASNSQSSCLSYPSAMIKGVHLHAQLRRSFKCHQGLKYFPSFYFATFNGSPMMNARWWKMLQAASCNNKQENRRAASSLNDCLHRGRKPFPDPFCLTARFAWHSHV
jgi:hypothetical protein